MGIDSSDYLVETPYLHRVSLQDFMYPAHSFDRIYSSWSLFSYTNENRQLKKAGLMKCDYLLKVGGEIRLSQMDGEQIRDIIKDIHSLRVSQEGMVKLKGGVRKSYIELTKVA